MMTSVRRLGSGYAIPPRSRPGCLSESVQFDRRSQPGEGEKKVNIVDVTELLETFSNQGAGTRSELGTRDNAAFLKFTLESDPDDFAVIWTPGHSWYQIDVRGGFGAVYFDDDASDAEVVEILERYLRGALAYLHGHRTTIRSRILRVPSLRIDTEDGPMRLSLSVAGGLRAIFRRQ
jgi:hypothetical protein